MNFQKANPVFVISLFAVLLSLPGFSAFAAETDCLSCHAKLRQEKHVHPALEMGCTACHGALDASKVPHRKTNNIARGLSSEQPDLCYGCHDKAEFSKANIHPAVSMGCTACHNPHSSKNAKLLRSEIPDLCYSCHDRKPFNRKKVHPPVQAGACLNCHNPHSSDQMALLKKKPAEVCLECHDSVLKKTHVVSGFSTNSHPVVPEKKERVRDEKTKKWIEVVTERKDPLRPDTPFYCGSCHDPHSSDGLHLFKFRAKSTMDICVNCHKY